MKRNNIKVLLLLFRVNINLKVLIALFNIHIRTSGILCNRIGQLSKLLPQIILLLDEPESMKHLRREKWYMEENLETVRIDEID